MISDVSLDCETRLIEAGRLDPDLVCISFCDESFTPELLTHDCAFETLRELFRNARIVGANFAFDACVIVRRFPELMPDVFAAYFDDRVIDCQISQKLIDLSRGQLFGYLNHQGTYVKRFYSLAALHAEYGFGELAKVDTWRLRYGELIDVPLSEWPEDAKKYALDDAVATLRVHRAQQQYADVLGDGPAQARAHFALQMMSVRGMITDAKACDEFLEETKADIERCRLLLEVEGVVRPNGSKDTKKAKARMEAVCAEGDLPVKKTATGGTCLDAEACRDSGDPLLKAYATYTSSKTILEKAALIKLGSTGIPLQTRFEILMDNGRTSSREPGAPLIGANLQNLPREGKLRECFVPRPGFWFCSVDYNSMELFCLAQVQFWATGASILGDALNEGKDVHCMLAATLLGCTYEEALANKKVGKYAAARQIAKAGNFGFSANMGPKRFMQSVNKAAKRREDRIDLPTATKVKKAWLATWKMDSYFDWAQAMLSDNGQGMATIRQFVSGRVRGNVNYTEIMNGFFSGLAADASKSTLLPISYECYVDTTSPLFGSRPVLHIHDENLLEVPIATAHEAAFRLRDVMCEQGSKYTPNYPLQASPALMSRWVKNSSEVYDHNGRLTACDLPPPAAPKRSPLLQSLMG